MCLFCVITPLIHIWTKGEVCSPWNRLKPSSKIYLLTFPRRCFLCGSFLLFLSWFCCAFVRVCSLMSCGHLLGKGWPLGSRLWCLVVKLSLSHGVLCQMWCLIVSISDICPLSYFGSVITPSNCVWYHLFGVITPFESRYYAFLISYCAFENALVRLCLHYNVF